MSIKLIPPGHPSKQASYSTDNKKSPEHWVQCSASLHFKQWVIVVETQRNYGVPQEVSSHPTSQSV